MNEFDRPDETNDAVVRDALHQLPPTPDHRPGFWADLDAQMAADSTEGTTTMPAPRVPTGPRSESAPSDEYANVTDLQSRRPNAVIAGILGAAAIVLLAVVVGLSMRSDDDVTTPGPATDPSVGPTVAPTTPTSTTPDATPTSEVPGATGDPATTTQSTASTTGDVGQPPLAFAATNELFQYHVLAPADWTETQSFGRSINFYPPADKDGFRTVSLEVVTFFPGDEPDNELSYFSGSNTALEDVMLEVPLWSAFSQIDGSSVLDETVPVRQATFAPDDNGNGQVLRIAELGDRTIVSSVRFPSATGIPGGWTPGQVLDGVRIQQSNGTVAPPTSCSAEGMTIPPTPTELNAAQATRFEAIVAAVTACDWTAIEAELSADGFTASFGGGKPIETWQNEERYGGTIMRRLIEHLSVPVTIIEPDGTAAWPRATNIIDWSDPDPEILAELEALGYDPLWIDDDLGYLGYRTGIDADGEWTYFVAGD